MQGQIKLDECRCIVPECLYNVDYNCIKDFHNISPNFNSYNGINCKSKIVCEEKKREYIS